MLKATFNHLFEFSHDEIVDLIEQACIANGKDLADFLKLIGRGLERRNTNVDPDNFRWEAAGILTSEVAKILEELGKQ